MLTHKQVSLFWSKVDIGNPDDCWPYTGRTDSWGYGSVRLENKQTAAHRVAWILTDGDIPKGLLVCHHCDNPPCCNPEHLFLGTNYDNVQDMVKKGRQIKGEDSIKSKLNEDQVKEIRKLKPLFSHSQLGAIFGVSRSAIYHIVKRHTWKHIPLEES